MKYTFLIAFLFIGLTTFSQEQERYTEAEIAIQDKFVLAKKYMLIGKFENARDILDELYKLDRTNAAVAMELSKVYSYLEDYYNEHRFAKKAAENAPNNEFVQSNYGGICFLQKKYDEAVTVFESLVQKYPEDEEYVYKLSDTYLQVNRDKDAIEVLNNLEKIVGVNENTSKRKFEIYEITNQDENAAEELKMLAETFPNETRYWHNLASFYTKIGEEKKALEVYKIIIELDKNDVDANVALTRNGKQSGSDATYLRSLQPIIENKTVALDRKVMELIPYINQLNQNYDDDLAEALIKLTDQLSAIHADDAKAFAIKGDVLFATSRYEDAINAYKKTLELNDNVYPVWESLINALYYKERYNEMLDYATDALDYYPNQPSAYLNYGKALTLNNEIDEAKDILNEGLMVSGNDAYFLSNLKAELARANLYIDNTSAAETLLKESLKISNNNNFTAFEIYGDLYIKEGNTKQAVEQWKKSAELGNTSPQLLIKLETQKI